MKHDYFVRSCKCGCKFILLPYHVHERSHRPHSEPELWNTCHTCYRRMKQQQERERIQRGIEGLRREFEQQVKQAQERAADLTFKAWGMRP